MRPSVLVSALVGAVVAVSTAAVVILLAEPITPLAIAAGRVAVTGLGLVAVALVTTRPAPSASLDARTLRLRTLVAAALLALHFGAWIASLSLTSVVRSVTLVTTQPLFAGLLARALGDIAPPRLYVGAAVALVGTAIMLGIGGDAMSTGPGWGEALAVIAAAAAAGYFAIGRSVRDVVTLPGYLARVHLWAAAMLALVLLAFGLPLATGPIESTDLLALLFLGLVPGLVGHGLLNVAVRHLPVHTVALAVLLEPVGASILAAIVLHRAVTLLELAGGAVILLGVALAIPRRRP